MGLRMLAGIAATLLLTGKAPALADEAGQAQAWVAANQDQLPRRYADFAGHSLEFRRAIFRALPTNVQAGLWREHLARNGKGDTDLSQAQQRVLADAVALLGDEST